MMHAICLGLTLFGTWLLLSGHYTPLPVSFGVLSCILIVYLIQRMEIRDHETHPIHLTPGVFVYWLWLAKEVVLSNIAMARLILSPSLPISPRLVRVQASQKDELCQVIYANSITLTPGTVTMDIDRGSFLVHAVAETFADDLVAGEMNRRVVAVENRG